MSEQYSAQSSEILSWITKCQISPWQSFEIGRHWVLPVLAGSLQREHDHVYATSASRRDCHVPQQR